jgi:hypothetical protein
MSNRACTLIIGAMLAAMHLVGMTTLAQASDQPAGQQATLRPPTERQVGESWRHRQAASQEQTAADATVKRVQARERFSIPDETPAPVPVPAPAEPGRPPGWLIASLPVLIAALALAGLAARWTRRRARLHHAA